MEGALKKKKKDEAVDFKKPFKVSVGVLEDFHIISLWKYCSIQDPTFKYVSTKRKRLDTAVFIVLFSFSLLLRGLPISRLM